MAALSRIDAEGVLFPWDLAVRVVELDGGVGSLNADVAAYVERQHGGAPMFEGVRNCGEVADTDGRALITQLHNHLASALELWFERYSAEWLSIGRHAELNRVAHVVWTFADILRAGRL